ncbi:Maf family protein [Oceanibacterium hippocampi]|uniref:dTTP/UTP pyrophosphatase n=1 Tax=Oceanibacterium hippocampi TaxID=745714 RepID=A0A1Y5S2P2_9PROT|nr:nucleoside triphosphate pyrophosphatase [Oceanibacterium hippocampi]SLN31237.1 Maf-like protein YhdE [Oceanibacterium hippocampi]
MGISQPFEPPPLTLASASPRRVQLLRQLRLEPAAVDPAEIDETPRAGESARLLAGRLASGKAAAVAPRHAGHFVLAADTVVALGRRILPKAEDEASARHCLNLLSGRAHRVYTGLALIAPDGREATRVVASRVTFKRLDRAEIDGYLASGEWHGKAGGYAIQGLAAAFVSALQGSYSAVVGLPLHETACLLTGLGYPLWQAQAAAPADAR